MKAPFWSLDLVVRPLGASGYQVVNARGEHVLEEPVKERKHAELFISGVAYAMADMEAAFGMQAASLRQARGIGARIGSPRSVGS